MARLGPCEALEGCDRRGRLREYTNALGDRARHFYCDRHAAALQNPEQREELLQRAWCARDEVVKASARLANDPALVVPPEKLAKHPVQRALNDHNEACAPCRASRQRLMDDIMAGRIRAEDVQAIGHRVLRECCPVGIDLQRQFGEIMTGQRKP